MTSGLRTDNASEETRLAGPGLFLAEDNHGDVEAAGLRGFPLQVVINLSEPACGHTGGRFLLVEQRPRAQSRGTATVLPHGHGYVFTTERPVRSTRGWSAVRHGVSML